MGSAFQPAGRVHASFATMQCSAIGRTALCAPRRLSRSFALPGRPGVRRALARPVSSAADGNGLSKEQGYNGPMAASKGVVVSAAGFAVACPGLAESLLGPSSCQELVLGSRDFADLCGLCLGCRSQRQRRRSRGALARPTPGITKTPTAAAAAAGHVRRHGHPFSADHGGQPGGDCSAHHPRRHRAGPGDGACWRGGAAAVWREILPGGSPEGGAGPRPRPQLLRANALVRRAKRVCPLCSLASSTTRAAGHLQSGRPLAAAPLQGRRVVPGGWLVWSGASPRPKLRRPEPQHVVLGCLALLPRRSLLLVTAAFRADKVVGGGALLSTAVCPSPSALPCRSHACRWCTALHCSPFRR